MNVKKIRRKLFVLIAGSTLVLVVLLLLGLVYLKLNGLKTALEELVLTETNGQYTLNIARAKVDLTSLSFAFDSVAVTRNPNLPEKGIRGVTITKVRLQVANLGAMFRSKKYDIRTLIIDEPLIQIDNHKAHHDTAQTKFHLGQQIVRLYPPIEQVLSRFSIEHLKINGASLGVNNKPKPPLSLNLVDFLIEEWQENRLTENSQIKLNIGEQDLSLERADFSFSGVEYNLQEHLLRIEDVRFATADSVTKSHVRVAAEALVLKRLGYQDLFEKQRLTYNKVTVLNPDIDLRLILKSEKDEEKELTNEQEVLTRIVKQSVGECIVDTVEIENAAFKTVLYKGTDSTILAVPQFNFTLYTLEVLNDQETFHTGTADIELNKTNIALNAGMHISCQNLHFDQDRNLNFTDVVLYDAVNNMEVLECHSLALADFHLLPLLFDRELLVESVTLRDAVLNVPPNNIFGTAGKGQKKGLSKITIKQIGLENVALRQITEDRSLTARGIWLNVQDLYKEPEQDFSYAFRNLKVSDIWLVAPKQEADVHISNFTSNGNIIQTSSARLLKGELEVFIKDLKASHLNTIRNLEQIDYKNWDAITAGDVKISGKLPVAQDKSADSANVTHAFNVGSLSIKNLEAKLEGPTFTTSFLGNDLQLNQAKFEDGNFAYKNISGNMKDVSLKLQEADLTLAAAQLELPKTLNIHDCVLNTKGKQVQIPRAILHQLVHKGERWSLKHAHFKNIAFSNGDAKLLETDSLLVKDIAIGGKAKARVNYLELFGPEINLTHNEQSNAESGNAKPFDTAVLEQLQHIVIHPGKLRLKNDRVIKFGTTRINTKTRNLNCAYVHTELPKFTVDLKGLKASQFAAQVDSFILEPNVGYKPYQTEEQSIITAKVYNSTYTGFDLDELMKGASLTGLNVTVPQFYIKAFRDKRLPDQPYVEKPATLGGMLKLPEFISLNEVNLKGGTIEIVLISDVTGKRGALDLTDVWANVTFNYNNPMINDVSLLGGGKLYGQGVVHIDYKTLDNDMFSLKANVQNFDLVKLNEMVLPLQAVEIKSGHLVNYDLDVIANNNKAVGDASITYKKLHLIIYKKEEPEKKNLGTTLVTLLADGLVVRDSKKNATASVDQPRVKEKGTFHYWVAAATHGALNAIRQGKRKRR